MPLEFPVFSPGETRCGRPRCCSATSRAWTSRRRSAANPIDGVVLLAGCDKTTPALLMGAASVDLPAIVVSGGPMLNGWFRGERIGSGTQSGGFAEDGEAGAMTAGGLPRRRSGR